MKADLGAIRRKLKKVSPLLSVATFAIKCCKCGNWCFSYHVFCPWCMEKMSSVNEFEDCRLTSCKIDGCPGHKGYEHSEVESLRNACCRHTSRQPKGKNVTIKTLESICASLIESGLYMDCALLSEDQLLEELHRAEYWGYYSSLFSLNAATVFRELGYHRIAEEIELFHNTNEKSSIQVLQSDQEQLRKDVDYLERHRKGK